MEEHMEVGDSRQYGFIKTTYNTQGKVKRNEVSESYFDSTVSLFDGDGESKHEMFETQALMDD